MSSGKLAKSVVAINLNIKISSNDNAALYDGTDHFVGYAYNMAALAVRILDLPPSTHVRCNVARYKRLKVKSWYRLVSDHTLGPRNQEL